MRAAAEGREQLRRMVYAALLLALSLVLPLLTGQLPRLGATLCPMHLPVLLAGFLCGGVWAAAVGVTAPLLRWMIFSTPTLMPMALTMSVELAVYGLAAGVLWKKNGTRRGGIYRALIGAMLAGRMAWGAAAWVLYGVAGMDFGWKVFFSTAFVQTLGGAAVQLVIVPAVVMALRRSRVKL